MPLRRWSGSVRITPAYYAFGTSFVPLKFERAFWSRRPSLLCRLCRRLANDLSKVQDRDNSKLKSLCRNDLRSQALTRAPVGNLSSETLGGRKMVVNSL